MAASSCSGRILRKKLSLNFTNLTRHDGEELVDLVGVEGVAVDGALEVEDHRVGRRRELLGEERIAHRTVCLLRHIVRSPIVPRLEG